MSTTYFKDIRHWSFNEGYDFRMRFPWIQVCLSMIGKYVYFSVAFRDKVFRLHN